MARKQTKSADDLIKELRHNITKTKQPRPNGGTGAAAIGDELEAGRSVRVVKPFKWGKQQYQPGDEFAPEAEDRTRVLQMAGQGWFVTEKGWQSNFKNQAYKKLYQDVEPVQSLLIQYRGQIDQTDAEIVDLQERLSSLETKRADLAERAAQAENEIVAIIEGDKIG